jgi:hypothetical protein
MYPLPKIAIENPDAHMPIGNSSLENTNETKKMSARNASAVVEDGRSEPT